MVVLVCNKKPFSAGGNQLILRKCRCIWTVIILMKLVMQLWLSSPLLQVFFASPWVDRLTPKCLCYRELVIKGLCIA